MISTHLRIFDSIEFLPIYCFSGLCQQITVYLTIKNQSSEIIDISILMKFFKTLRETDKFIGTVSEYLIQRIW